MLNKMFEQTINNDKSNKIHGICMNQVVEFLENNNCIKISDLDSNGWDADFSQVFYSVEHKKYILASASGYYGYARMLVISEEEAMMSIDECSVEDIIEANIPEIITSEIFKKRVREIDDLNQFYSTKIAEVTQLLKEANELIKDTED